MVHTVLWKKFCRSFLALLSLIVMGCLSLEHEWPDIETPSRNGDITSLLAQAKAQTQQADTRDNVLALIETYEAALDIDPRHAEALSYAAQYHTLVGTGYSESLAAKKHHFRKAIHYSERIMYLNPDFQARVDAGSTVWEASEVLTRQEADGMGWWATAVFYYFKECIPNMFKIFNGKWVKRNKQLMDRIAHVALDWQGGANYFNLGIYYLALPAFAGGDIVRSAAYLNKAESAGPERLLIPWGRAKYFHYTAKNRHAFEKDLQAVLARDPHRQTGDTYPWNVYFQRQARQLLASVDDLF